MWTSDGNCFHCTHNPITTNPLPMQARVYTEHKILNREVRAVLHSADQGARVYGELVFPEDGKPVSLAESLLGAGLARYVDWSARMLPLKPPAALVSASGLKKAETAAQVRSPQISRLLLLLLLSTQLFSKLWQVGGITRKPVAVKRHQKCN
jgi:hypothetical protein